MSREIIKACVYCEHFDFEEGFSYSSWTSESSKFSCSKNHFSYQDPDSLYDLYDVANNCNDFALEKSVIRMLEERESNESNL